MPRPNAEARSQRVNTASVERSCLNQSQGSLDRSARSLPGRTEGGRFGAAAKAGTVAGAFRCSGTWVEANIARQRCSDPADGPAINPRRFNGREHDPIQ